MPLRHQDPTTGRWNGIDPVTHFSSSTYASHNNNPVFWADPSGADFICAIRTEISVALGKQGVKFGLNVATNLGVSKLTGKGETVYEDENGNEILRTNDGSDAVVVVPSNKIDDFKNIIERLRKLGKDLNLPEYNDYWKQSYLGFRLSEKQELFLTFLHGNDSKRDAIISWQDPSIENMFNAALSEVKGQWQDPEHVINSLSPYKLKPTHFITKGKKPMKRLFNQIKEEGKIKTSIKYIKHNGSLYIVDGHHRYYSALKLGIESVPVEEVKLPYLGYKSITDLILEGSGQPGFWRFIKK